MENYKAVLPEHLNQHGFLFGGYLLMWVDEFAWIAASIEYPDCSFVTVALDQVVFKKSVKAGSILKFCANKKRQGTTSVEYEITVLRNSEENKSTVEIFSTCVTLVRVDNEGNKIALP